MTVINFPSARWRVERLASITPSQAHWLKRPGALTNGLRRLGEVKLRVLAEYAQALPREEAVALGVTARRAVWVREVAMAIDGVDCVIARSITPLRASHGVWQGIRRLRTRPLADMLYNEAGIERSAFTCARPAIGSPIHRTVKNVSPTSPAAWQHANLLARRSVFWRQGQPLIVAECFLPAFWRIAAGRHL